ncbi:hypothetical protein [Desulforhopalus sp. IMCC35007]|uniref:hypothetical protein n=1 Tax=Desulforhopalus sp. IMCC35007 TaxID=2569543 RepID=UPI0010AE9421|nr:hypothetical protein [Desulforhopalus sp. IMCC35007]TKB07289.1 hypothetical protein FCL48_17610 [Desulforhopalus sp. IMCC35007]
MSLFTISNHFRLLWRIMLVSLVLCCFTILNPSANLNASPAAAVGPDLLHNSKTFEKKLEDQWGIELTALRMTAADRMIDFRYRVLDADKAAPLFKRQTKPYLIHQASGKVLAVPNTAKVGSLRNSNMPKEGRIYWMFFGNQGVVKAGDKVSVVIGDFRAENLVID